VNSSSPSGRYNSARRRQQAAETRGAILAAASRLFVERGYAGTSLEAIAQEAGVAVQTVYNSVGGKRALLPAINDFIDEEAGLEPALAELEAATDPHRLLRLTVRLTRQFAERKGDYLAVLEAAATSDPDLGSIMEEGRRRHRAGTLSIASKLASFGALRPGLTAARAGQILGVITWVENHTQLVRDYGLSYDEAEDWLTSILEDLLFGETTR
jgi:AcrR family transcriptional regulator